MLFERTAVIGIGMIGGSFALAARQAGLVGRVVGVARTERTLRQARDLALADETTTDPLAAVQAADLVYLAAPVAAICELLGRIAGALPAGCVLTDAGSTKRQIVARAREVLPSHCTFIGGHPMAGSEQAGPAAARADLFRGCSYFLTPDSNADPDDLDPVRELIRGIGAQPIVLDAETHDRLLAATSHLPHLVAAALCGTVGGRAADLARYSGRGLRDTTRIALGPEEVWRDILLSNADNLRTVLDDLDRWLEDFRSALQAGDGDRLLSLLRSARAVRERLVE